MLFLIVYLLFLYMLRCYFCSKWSIQCFDAVGCASGRASGL